MRKRQIQQKTVKIAGEISGAIWALEDHPLEERDRQDVMIRWLREWRSELARMSSKKDRLIHESIVSEVETEDGSPFLGSRLLRMLER